MARPKPVAARQPPPVGIRPSSEYLPELESLRGLAISLVFSFHLDGLLTSGQQGLVGQTVAPWRAFVPAGHTGVTLFFALSAFLLSRPFLAEALGGRRVDRTAYYLRRALRILPLYWSAVIVATLLSGAHPRQLLLAPLRMTFLRPMEGFSSPLWPYDAVWWSLATEAQFYLLLPLLPWFLQSPRRRTAGLVVVLIYAATYAAFLVHIVQMWSSDAQATLSHSLFGRAPVFACGIGAAYLYERFGKVWRARWAESRVWRSGGGDFLLLASLLGLGTLLSAVLRIGYPNAEYHWHGWHVFEGVLWTVVLMLFLLAPLRLKPLFSNRALFRLGVLSYSIYMIHYPLLDLSLRALRRSELMVLFGWNLRTLFVGAGIAAGCLTLSWLTYTVIERPFLSRKARLDHLPEVHGR